jgi:Nitrate/nitrite transporter
MRERKRDRRSRAGIGLGVALLVGGLLLGVWQPFPFLVAAATLAVTTLALVPVFRLQARCGNSVLPYEPASLRTILVRSPNLRRFSLVNALWEFSFAGLKSFIVLYIVRGLGRSPAVASAVIAVVAVAYVVGAPLAGRLADRYGLVRVLRVSSLFYGAGLLVGVVPHSLAPLLIGSRVALAGRSSSRCRRRWRSHSRPGERGRGRRSTWTSREVSASCWARSSSERPSACSRRCSSRPPATR